MRIADPDLQRFAAAIVHDLRTPLSALSVEVELALTRERSAAAYRDTVVRIADLVDELFDQTRDLAALADAYDPAVVQAQTASLASAVKIAGRYPSGTVSFDFGDDTASRRVVGDELLVVRAIALLVDHAVRHVETGDIVRVRTLPCAPDQPLVVLIDAMPALPADVWSPLESRGLATQDAAHAAALRLAAAANMVRACGGTVSCPVDSAAVRVELRGSAQ
jgi:signal transduction histidine kinase